MSSAHGSVGPNGFNEVEIFVLWEAAMRTIAVPSRLTSGIGSLWADGINTAD